MNEIDRRIDTALKGAVRQRNYRRIRDRALARLSRLHPNDYADLLEEERARDEAESKKWLDITGRTNRTVDSAGSPNERSEVSE
jgi:hypothetical protein